MRAVLGIDAAWTLKNPSGVALAIETTDGWRLKAVSRSYDMFYALVENTPMPQRPKGSAPDARRLLTSAEALADRAIDLVAIDMPLAHLKIEKRRFADNEVSRRYGAKKCGTHSPSGQRPGVISDELTRDFRTCGYPLITSQIKSPGLVEVYPHPAFVELSGASERLQYKHAKIGSYWKAHTPAERIDLLLANWELIIGLLERKISGVARLLPPLKPGAAGLELKSYEDAIDAVACAWIAICCLDGKAKAHGDGDSAIWIPCLD